MEINETSQKICKVNENIRQMYEDANFNAGLMVFLFSGWVTIVLIFSKFVNDSSYRNLANYTISAALGRVVYVLHDMPVLTIIHDMKVSKVDSCELFEFWQTFISVLEMETLTHVCIERYVTARDKAKGLAYKNYNKLYIHISLLFAVVYAYPELVGLGVYGKNYPCLYDIADLKGWASVVFAFVFIGRTIKPLIFMAVMLYWASSIEKSIKNNEEQSSLTKGVIVLVLISCLCWLPINIYWCCALMNSLIYGNAEANDSAVMLYMFAHQVAPGLGLVGLVAVDGNLRNKITNVFRRIRIISKTPTTALPVAEPVKTY